MKKTISMIIGLLMVLSMVGGVFAGEYRITKTEQGDDILINVNYGFLSKIKDLFTGFWLADNDGQLYNGKSYDCDTYPKSGIGHQFTADKTYLEYENENSFPVTLEIFKSPNWNQVGSTLEIGPYSDDRIYGLVVGGLYAFDIYYCDTIHGSTVCTDSDGGLDYYRKGTTSKQYPYTQSSDKCNGDILTEYYCGGISIIEVLSENYNCPFGCTDGACNIVSEITCYKCEGANLQTQNIVDYDCPPGWSETELDCETTSLITCYKCEGDNLLTEKKESCSSGYSTIKPTSCGGLTTITCYKCDSGVLKTETVTSCSPGYSTIKPTSCEEEPTDKPYLQEYQTATYKIIDNYEVEVTFYLENKGEDMTENWILELQPDKSPTGIMSIFGFVSERQETCDLDSPENVHKEFKLKKGEKAEIKISLTGKNKIPEEQTFGGNTYLFPIVRKGCSVGSDAIPNLECQEDYTGCKNQKEYNGCFKLPYCDGKSDVNYKDEDTGALSESSIPVVKKEETVCCFQGISHSKTANYNCMIESECSSGVPPRIIITSDDDKRVGFCPVDCLPSKETVPYIKLETLEEKSDTGKTRAYLDHDCRVNEECQDYSKEEISCMDLDKIGEKIDDTEFKDKITAVTTIGEKTGMCIFEGVKETDMCGWTNWAPEGFLGQCGNAYAIVIVIFMIGMIWVNSTKRQY